MTLITCFVLQCHDSPKISLEFFLRQHSSTRGFDPTTIFPIPNNSEGADFQVQFLFRRRRKFSSHGALIGGGSIDRPTPHLPGGWSDPPTPARRSRTALCLRAGQWPGPGDTVIFWVTARMVQGCQNHFFPSSTLLFQIWPFFRSFGSLTECAGTWNFGFYA